jgi:excinuclease ABC subunit C
MKEKIKKQLPQLPHSPGVYLFLDSRKKIIYIGKAADLKNRARSYFRKSETTNPLKSALIEKAAGIKWLETDSEIEALISEAELIKKHRPDFNVLLKDSSDYFYVGITRETFPKVFVTHQPFSALRIKNKELTIKNKKSHNSLFKIHNSKFTFIGPFTDGTALKNTLKLIRLVFPFCTCRQLHKRPCLNVEMGRCPGICCLKPELAAKQPGFKKKSRQYRKNIAALKKIITGKKQKPVSDLNQRMKKAAVEENFEKAAILRDQVENLRKIFSHQKVLFHKSETANWPITDKIIQKLLGVKRDFRRIEAYDISHISGKSAVGAMVVFKNGEASPGDYRRFKIKTAARRNDPAMMREIIRRRIHHPDWPWPDLILVDGGTAQLNAAVACLKKNRLDIAAAAIAKGKNELHARRFKNPRRLNSLPPELKLFFLRIRDQAHRFAVKYHRKLRKRGSTPLEIQT